jgi:XTP/dITP diphosphohydrolase
VNGPHVLFATSNQRKFAAAQSYFGRCGLHVEQCTVEIPELQHPDVGEIALAKARHAHRIVGRPVMVEDSAFYVHSLGGFPGPYVKHMMDTIGVPGLLKLVEDTEDRSAHFESALAYQWDDQQAKVFLEPGPAWEIRSVQRTGAHAGWSSLWDVLEARTGPALELGDTPVIYQQFAAWMRTAEARSSAGTIDWP